MSSSVNVGHNRPIWYIVQGNGAWHNGFDALSACCPNFALSHEFDRIEEVDLGLVAGITMYIQRNFFHTSAIFDMRHDVEGIVQERPVDHVSHFPLSGA
jgi:hypothetical protein